MSQRPVPPRGMRDLLPDEVLQRRHLLGRILDVYERYGFQQIETPLVEDIDRLLGSGGGENEKMLYKVLKRGLGWPVASEAEAVDLGLRYDLTVPLARYYATHSNELLHPFKSIQSGAVFRAERPQKGRYRQFTQCDIDIIGDESSSAEVELVVATAEALHACEVGEFVVRMNDRRLLDAILDWAEFVPAQRAEVLIVIDKLDKIGIRGVRDELALIDDGGRASDRLGHWLNALLDVDMSFIGDIADLPSTAAKAVYVELQSIEEAIQTSGVKVATKFDPTLVRGMGYYTGAIFEIAHPESSGSLGGGGRYDRMIGQLSGQEAPACGFSIGFERLCNLLGDRIDTTGGKRRIVFLHDAEVDITALAPAAQTLRADGDVVRREVATKNRSAQLKRFTQAGFTHWAEFRPGLPPNVQPLSTSQPSSSQPSTSQTSTSQTKEG